MRILFTYDVTQTILKITGNIKDLFVTFKDRVRERKYFLFDF